MAVPTGQSGQSAIALVRDYANEPTLPADSTVLTFLNRGVEEVVRRIGGIRLWKAYYTVANQTTVFLNDDVLEIVSANFSSSGNPYDQGALVYPMMALEQASFMDAAAGFPANGFGPPQAYFIYQDEGYASTNTLPAPAAPVLSTTSGTSTGTEIEAVITYTNTNASGATGETTASDASDITPTTAQQAVVATPQSYGNATGYHVYAGAVGGPYYLQDGGTATALGSSFTIPGTLVTGTATPPGSNTATGVGQGGSQQMQLYPSAMVGQVNIYYKARPQLWADATQNSYTNLDSSAQEAVILFATMRTLAYRGRGDEIASWRSEYEATINDLKETMNRRVVPPSGRVRDVMDRSYPSAPYWMTG